MSGQRILSDKDFQAQAPLSDADFADSEEAPASAADYLKSALMGAQNGLTLGYAPQISAGLSRLNPFDQRGYTEARDQYIENERASKALNPSTYGLGSTVGGIGSALAMPMSVPERGAGLAAKLISGAGTGAAVGALGNPGDTKGRVDPGQLSQRLQNALSGAKWGAGIAGAGVALGRLGKGTYGAPIQPIEFQGEKMGKSDINDTLYDLGFRSPINIRQKAAAMIPQLAEEKNAILQQATDAGGQVDMLKALRFAQARIATLRNSQDKMQHDFADELEKQIAPLVEKASGKPGTADQIVSDLVPSKGYHGEPIQVRQERTIPGKPAVPPAKFTPSEVNDMASIRYMDANNSAYNQNTKSPVITNFEKSIPKGMKDAYLDSVDQTLGPAATAKLKDVNKKLSVLLSTKPAQQTVSNQAARDMHSLVAPTGTDKLLFSMGAMSEDPRMPWHVLAVKKAADAAKVLTMPMGYLMRKTGENYLPQLTKNPWIGLDQQNNQEENK